MSDVVATPPVSASPATSSSAKKASGAMQKTAGTISLGVMVVILYIVFVFIVFAGFGSYIYRGDWIDNLKENPIRVAVATTSEAAATTAATQTQEMTSLDNLIFIVKRKKDLAAQLEVNRSEAILLDAAFATHDANYKAKIGANIRLAAHVLIESRKDIKDLTKILGTSNVDYLKQMDQIDQALNEQPHIRITRAQSLVRGISVPLEFDDMSLTRFNAAMDTFRAKQVEIDKTLALQTDEALGFSAARSDVEKQQSRNEAQFNTITTEMGKLEKIVGLGSPHNARYESLYFEFFIPYIGTSFQRLVSFPTIFLTLIVTIAAGALGTVVSFSRRYYRSDSEGLTMSRLFVNVGEGIAAAIAIFLFSGAGMLALTQGGGAQSEVELSPYTVAFIAFLSGFMAEDAFASIQNAGKRLFHGGNGKADKDVPQQQVPDAQAEPQAAPTT